MYSKTSHHSSSHHTSSHHLDSVYISKEARLLAQNTTYSKPTHHSSTKAHHTTTHHAHSTKNNEMLKKIGKEGLSTGLDFIPIVGTIKSGLEAITGKDLVTGEKVNRGLAVLGMIPEVGAVGKAVKHGVEVEKIVKDGIKLEKGIKGTKALSHGKNALKALKLKKGTHAVHSNNVIYLEKKLQHSKGILAVHVESHEYKKVVNGSHTHHIVSAHKIENSMSKSHHSSPLGGAYKDVPSNGGEVHHMPANSVSPLSKRKGPAIRMEKDDHRETDSWGSSNEAKAYRAKQKKLIENGHFEKAQAMDIKDVRSKFGKKYDEGIKQMIKYTKKLK